MSRVEHWESIYSTKAVADVSWFCKHLEPSLELIESAKLEKDTPIIDVGGGASTLVDDLLDRGFTDITVLDISHSALDKTKQRLRHRAASVT